MPLHGQVKFVPSIRNWFSFVPDPNADTVVTVPLDVEVRTLAEFRDALGRVSHDTFYHHFIASRLRLHLGTNDFSNWLATDLQEPELARRANRIDIYTNTLDTARDELIELADGELKS